MNKEIDIEQAIRTYGDMVLKLAVLNTNSKTEAEDVFQEVFLKLFRYQESITGEEHLKAWLIRVTINQSHSHTTSYWNKNTTGLDGVSEAEDGNALKDFLDVESESEVTAEVMKLKPKYRNVIHLYYYEGLSISEIASALGEKEATVKTRMARARKLLKEKLVEGGYRI